MNRSVKNCIMITMVIALIIGSYLVMNSLKNNASNDITINERIKANGDREFKFDNNTNMKGKNRNKETKDNRMMPQNHGDEQQNDGSNLPFDENNRPSRDNKGSMPPEFNGGNTPPDIPSGNMEVSTSNKIETYHYVIFGINSLVISCIIVYLVMSKMNKKTFKESFQGSQEVVIAILSVLILTVGFTYLDIYLTNNYFIKNNNVTNNNGMKEPNNNSNISYSASTEITSNEDITSGSYTSNNSDENAISVSGNTMVNLSNVTISKKGDSDGGDSTSFYGTNSALIAKDGANVTIDNATIETNANGANGVFSYGGSATTNNSNSDGTIVNINNSKITTTANNSGGIMTTGGGIMNATNLSIVTNGISSAAIRSDRGGGKVTVDGGTYETNGQGSPSIYSTADIMVSNAKLISNASEGIVIEGANSVTLDNCELVDDNTKLNGQSTTYKNIFLYQSMSGDAKNVNATFTSKNSTITTNKGDSIYVTNTVATINLENNTFINNDTSGNFLRIKTDSWGNSGSNGGNVTLNMNNQKVNGNIVVDNISTLNMNLKNNSSFEGIINANNEAKEITLVLDKSSKIKLMSDSYITSLSNDDSTNSNIDFNGYKLYVGEKTIN